jgi:hypothetical protein
VDRLTTRRGSVRSAGLLLADGSTPGLPPYSFEVTDTASEYDYLIEVRSPDGQLFTYEGDVETVGNSFGGESCTPTMFRAELSINRNGELTTQQP